MAATSVILRDIQKNPLQWKLECPLCSSFISAKYALALAPILGIDILPYFYCHCTRFQVMEPRPAKLVSFQIVVVFYTFITAVLTSMVRYVLRRGQG